MWLLCSKSFQIYCLLFDFHRMYSFYSVVQTACFSQSVYSQKWGWYTAYMCDVVGVLWHGCQWRRLHLCQWGLHQQFVSCWCIQAAAENKGCCCPLPWQQRHTEVWCGITAGGLQVSVNVVMEPPTLSCQLCWNSNWTPKNKNMFF